MKYFLIVVTIFCLSIVDAKFDIYARGLRWTNPNKEYYQLHYCRLKAVRGHKGIIFGNGSIVKPLKYPVIKLQTFWQGSSQRFQPYYLDLRLRVCLFPNYLNTENKLIKVVILTIKKMLNPEVIEAAKQGCPLQPQKVITSNFEPDRDMKQWIPPIIPEGIFRFDATLYEQNITLVKWELTVEVKQIGMSDFIKLG